MVQTLRALSLLTVRLKNARMRWMVVWASLGCGSLLSVSFAYGTEPLDDLTTHYLLLAAAPIRDVKPGDQLNVLFIIVDDLNICLLYTSDAADE